MRKVSCYSVFITLCVVLILSNNVVASEKSLETHISTVLDINDNIFLEDNPPDTVFGVKLVPELFGVIKERNWETSLKALVRINKYSEHDLDSNDQYFDLTGRYFSERNIYSLNINHDLDSNLTSTSSDFGLVRRRVNRKIQGVTPQFTRLITERLLMVFAYSYTDVDYLDAEGTGFLPYVTQTGSTTLSYDLTKRNKLSASLQAVKYNSKNDLVTYDLFVSRVGIDHEFSRTLSINFLVGVSRQYSTNLTSQSFDFFGTPVIQTQEIDFNNRGLVLDAGVTKSFESGSLIGRISRDNTTNSFGGLDEVDRYSIFYDDKISEKLGYEINSSIRDSTSISSGTRTTDRVIFSFSTKFHYNISPSWNVSASYRYLQRKFKSDTTNENSAPHSNSILLSLNYNFIPLSAN